MRRPDVYLVDSEPRCQDNRMNVCSYADTCARALAPIPRSGAVVADFSINLTVFNSCGEWLSAANAKRPPHKEKERPVHPSVRGIV